MTHPIVYARNPDEVLYDADLGDTAWEAKAGINVLSTQATFDIPVEGETANGLRISLGRGTFTVEHANEVQVVTAVDTTLAAATAAYVEATLTLTITHSSGIQAFAAVKTAVDAITGIASVLLRERDRCRYRVRNQRPVLRRPHVLGLRPGDGRLRYADQDSHHHPGQRG